MSSGGFDEGAMICGISVLESKNRCLFMHKNNKFFVDTEYKRKGKEKIVGWSNLIRSHDIKCYFYNLIIFHKSQCTKTTKNTIFTSVRILMFSILSKSGWMLKYFSLAMAPSISIIMAGQPNTINQYPSTLTVSWPSGNPLNPSNSTIGSMCIITLEDGFKPELLTSNWTKMENKNQT